MGSDNVKDLAWMRRAAADGTARKIRKRAGVTQREIARACGVVPSAVNQWERGKRTPEGHAALRYARVLRDLDEFLSTSDA